MKKIILSLLIATGMICAIASAGFAHEIKNEHEGCDKGKMCLQVITCGKHENQVICYPTSCGPSNCDSHKHLEPLKKTMKK